MKIGHLVLLTLLIYSTAFAGQPELTFKDLTVSTSQPNPNNFKLSPNEETSTQGNVSYYYQYFDQDHTFGQDLGNLGIIYGISWALYPVIQHEDFDSGSWTEYKENFGKLVFDQDEPYWNWLVHPLTGSQLYLFYRSTGYSRFESFGMTFLSSALWEFTIEVYSEPASIQDLYQTPVMGSLLGFGLETLSMALLNQNNPMGQFFGSLFNLYTLFWWYDGKIQIVPSYYKKTGTVTIMGTF
jgi:hypothetical protein